MLSQSGGLSFRNGSQSKWVYFLPASETRVLEGGPLQQMQTGEVIALLTLLVQTPHINLVCFDCDARGQLVSKQRCDEEEGSDED
mmetsp:Transcript_49348/g.104985  ORF Transcript_49348/g.104985 Transcript_49348/m.104985 type:complete len:85 (-) Transcript_49348:90-344(-)